MKKRFIPYGLLFVLLMVLLFLPLLQQWFHPFEMKPLNGVFEPAPVPELTFDNCASGKWQAQVEPYISEHFGFREPVIRLYNQYVYDFFNKAYSEEVAVGKDGWLYQTGCFYQYFGLMNRQYKRTNKEFKDRLDMEVRSLRKIRAILQEHGVELMTFTLPVKSYVYPEHLRPHHFEDTLFNAGTYYDRKLTALGFPHINMNPWFEAIRDDYPFTLFYEKGSHWASGAVLGTDSLLRYMETLKGEHFPRVVMGEPYEVPEDQINPQDYDLAKLLNTFRKPRQHTPLYEFPVSIAADSATVYPNVLFVGSSYYWYMKDRVPFSKVFSNRDFMYYNLYYVTDEEQNWHKIDEINTLTELLTHDYIVYFQNAPQLYSDAYQFFGKALIALCISDERLEEKIRQVADSLTVAWHDEHPDWEPQHFRYQAKSLLQGNPELFEELRGDAVPAIRNPRMANVLAQRPIRADREWRFLLGAKAQNDSIALNALYAVEADNVAGGKPLLRNHTYFTAYDYFDFLVEETLKALARQPDTPTDRASLLPLALAEVEAKVQHHDYDNDSLMVAACVMSAVVRNLETETAIASLQKKAAQTGWSVDKTFREDVIWCYNNIDDPSRFLKENTIQNAFELYQIERKVRRDPGTMDIVRQRRTEDNLPLRVALDREVNWLYKKNS